MKVIHFDKKLKAFMATLNTLAMLVMAVFPVAGAETVVGATESLGAVPFPHEKNQKNRQTHEPNRGLFFASLNKGSIRTAVTLFAPERPLRLGGEK
jgi:hypothetical protein